MGTVEKWVVTHNHETGEFYVGPDGNATIWATDYEHAQEIVNAHNATLVPAPAPTDTEREVVRLAIHRTFATQHVADIPDTQADYDRIIDDLTDAAMSARPAPTDTEAADEPFYADCGRCARLAADRLPNDDARRFSFRMYLCPECGDKRCAKAADHEFKCDRGEAERAMVEVRSQVAALSARPAPTDTEAVVRADEELEAKVADTLAYYQCRETNPKADDPVMGYHAFNNDQREFLRSRKGEAAREIVRMMHALSATRPATVRAEQVDDKYDVALSEYGARVGQPDWMEVARRDGFEAGWDSALRAAGIEVAE